MPTADGVDLTVLACMRYGHNIVQEAKRLQEQAAEQIEAMTAFNVERINVEIRSLK